VPTGSEEMVKQNIPEIKSQGINSDLLPTNLKESTSGQQPASQQTEVAPEPKKQKKPSLWQRIFGGGVEEKDASHFSQIHNNAVASRGQETKE